MNYCSRCGCDGMAFEIPAGDSRKRYVCPACGEIFYTNPKIVAGCILEWEDRILLCKRAIEPRLGLWTVPAGFMENHESVAEAALRESLEEARAQAVETSSELQLHGLYNLKHISQVYMIYRGDLRDGHAACGEESSEVRLCLEKEIPWQQIAFLVIREALERYFEDRSRGEMRLHSADLDYEDGEVKIIKRS